MPKTRPIEVRIAEAETLLRELKQQKKVKDEQEKLAGMVAEKKARQLHAKAAAQAS